MRPHEQLDRKISKLTSLADTELSFKLRETVEDVERNLRWVITEKIARKIKEEIPHIKNTASQVAEERVSQLEQTNKSHQDTITKMRSDMDTTKAKTDKLDVVTGEATAMLSVAMDAIYYFTGGKVSISAVHKYIADACPSLSEDRIKVAEAARSNERAASRVQQEIETACGRD